MGLGLIREVGCGKRERGTGGKDVIVWANKGTKWRQLQVRS